MDQHAGWSSISWQYRFQDTRQPANRFFAVSSRMTSLISKVGSKGLAASGLYQTRIKEIEDKWKKRFGAASLAELRESLTDVVQDGSSAAPSLYRGLVPIPGNWRGPVECLPWYPMVLHRGGYPDGS